MHERGRERVRESGGRVLRNLVLTNRDNYGPMVTLSAETEKSPELALLPLAKKTADIQARVIARGSSPPRTSLFDARFRPRMVWLLAWRNLVHDRLRFMATLVGIAFSVVLMAVQWGLLI